MNSSNVDEAVVQDIIRHLFDPHSPTRRTSKAKTIRALISPELTLEFPLLPHETVSQRSPSAPKRSLESHSPSAQPLSAQALSAFRLPAIIVNQLPRSKWILEEIVEVRENLQEATGHSWTAVLRWQLDLQLPVSLPFGLDELAFHHQQDREVELHFAPRSTDHKDTQRLSTGPSSSGSKHVDDPQLLLTHVRYSGPKQPGYFELIPWHDTIAKLGLTMCALLLPLLYGMIVLLGFDKPARRRDWLKESRKSRERNRTPIGDDTGKGKAREQSADESRTLAEENLSDFTATSTSIADDRDYDSSFYLRLMRKGNRTINLGTFFAKEGIKIISETADEVAVLAWTIRRTVVLAAEGGLSMLGVGADTLGLLGADLGGNDSEEQRVRALNDAVRHGKLHGEEEEWANERSEGDSHLKRRSSSSSKKRVSFSFTDPFRDGLPSVDEVFNQFQADMDEAAAAHKKGVLFDEPESLRSEQTSSAAPQNLHAIDTTALATGEHQHVDTPVPSPHTEVKPLPFAMITDYSSSDAASQTKHFHSATPPRSPVKPASIASPLSPRPSVSGLVSPSLVSTPILEHEEDQADEEPRTDLSAIFGPAHVQERIQAIDSVVDEDEQREIDELLGVERDGRASRSAHGGSGNGQTNLDLSAAASAPISGSAFAAAAEELLYSPTNSATPDLSPDLAFSPPIASMLSPRTPASSPEMDRKSFSRGASAEGAQSARMEHESSGSWSSQGGAVVGVVGASSDVTVGEGHEGVPSGTRVRTVEASSSSSAKGADAPLASGTVEEPQSKSKKSKKKKSQKKKGGVAA